MNPDRTVVTAATDVQAKVVRALKQVHEQPSVVDVDPAP